MYCWWCDVGLHPGCSLTSVRWQGVGDWVTKSTTTASDTVIAYHYSTSQHSLIQHRVVCVSTQLLLMGTDCGLDAMQFINDIDHRPLTLVPGIKGTVHTIDGHTDAGLVFFIAGMCIWCDAEYSLLRDWLGYGYSYKASCARPTFVIFDIRALWHLGLSVRVLGCQTLQMTA